MKWWLRPRDKYGLLSAVVDEFKGKGALVSLEGDLDKSILSLSALNSGSISGNLKRQGESVPRTRFVVLPLTEECAEVIKRVVPKSRALDETGWLLHVQVEVDGHLVFGGYDSFHHECVKAGAPMTTQFLELLVSRGVLASYSVGSL